MGKCIVMLKKTPPGIDIQCSKCKKNFFLARNLQDIRDVIPIYVCPDCFAKIDAGRNAQSA